jgi:hypothetical protein
VKLKIIIIIYFIKINVGIGDWGLGIGDWGLGIGDWAQSPIPNPQSPINKNYLQIIIFKFYIKMKFLFIKFLFFLLI